MGLAAEHVSARIRKHSWPQATSSHIANELSGAKDGGVGTVRHLTFARIAKFD